MARKSKELVPIMVRMPEALRATLEKSAKRSGRSMNAEINSRLEQSFRKEDAAEQAEAVAARAARAVIEQLGLTPDVSGHAQGLPTSVHHLLSSKATEQKD
jgi:hypothetical protein